MYPLKRLVGLSIFFSLKYTNTYRPSLSQTLNLSFLLSCLWSFCSWHFPSGCRGDRFHSWIYGIPSPYLSPSACTTCLHTHSSTTQQTNWPNPPTHTAVHAHTHMCTGS